jgi:hypothetical protein
MRSDDHILPTKRTRSALPRPDPELDFPDAVVPAKVGGRAREFRLPTLYYDGPVRDRKRASICCSTITMPVTASSIEESFLKH